LGGEKLKSSWHLWGAFLAIILTFTCLFGVSSPLSAQSAENTETEYAQGLDPRQGESDLILGETPAAPIPSGSSSIFVALRMVLVLALAALAIYGVVFFIKRITRPQESRDPHLKILAKVSLSNDSYAAVISVGAKAWLVGGASGGVNLISEIDEPEALETMLLDDARKTAETAGRRFPDFRSLLSRLGRSSRDGNAGSPGNADSTHAENLRKQRERLKGL